MSLDSSEVFTYGRFISYICDSGIYFPVIYGPGYVDPVRRKPLGRHRDQVCRRHSKHLSAHMTPMKDFSCYKIRIPEKIIYQLHVSLIQSLLDICAADNLSLMLFFSKHFHPEAVRFLHLFEKLTVPCPVVSKPEIISDHYIPGIQLFHKDPPYEFLRLHPGYFRQKRTIHQIGHFHLFNHHALLFACQQSILPVLIKRKHRALNTAALQFTYPFHQLLMPSVHSVKFPQCNSRGLLYLKIGNSLYIYHFMPPTWMLYPFAKNILTGENTPASFL